MRTTASFDLFPDGPSERAMVRARWLAREGRVADAESAYRGVLRSHPDLKSCWAEYFELLRDDGRAEEALRLADGALAQFGDAAFPLALKGAALIELARFRDALAVLERAVEADADLALDRAFALEPHSETLKLRGRILRDAGRYLAAEVAFEGAAQAAEHPEQRTTAEHEIAATRRFAFYAPRKPDDLSAAERWFATTGSVVLASAPGPVPPSDAALVKAFAELAQDSGWHFGQIVTVGPALDAWTTLADALQAPLVPRSGFDTGAVALVAAPVPLADGWHELASAVAGEGTGLAFTLEHPAERPDAAAVDVIGV